MDLQRRCDIGENKETAGEEEIGRESQGNQNSDGQPEGFAREFRFFAWQESSGNNQDWHDEEQEAPRVTERGRIGTSHLECQR